MNHGSDRNKTEPDSLPARPCERCGGAIVELPVLDTRSGRNYRLVKCGLCGYLTWHAAGIAPPGN